MPNGFFTAKLCTEGIVCTQKTGCLLGDRLVLCMEEKNENILGQGLWLSPNQLRDQVAASEGAVQSAAQLAPGSFTCRQFAFLLIFHLYFGCRWTPKLGSKSNCKSDFTMKWDKAVLPSVFLLRWNISLSVSVSLRLKASLLWQTRSSKTGKEF